MVVSSVTTEIIHCCLSVFVGENGILKNSNDYLQGRVLKSLDQVFSTIIYSCHNGGNACYWNPPWRVRKPVNLCGGGTILLDR